MASSQNKCFVRSESGGYSIGQAPMNSAFMRDIYAENTCHLADEMTQPRVQWASKSGEYLSVSTDNALAKIVSFGPFPITMRPDGSTAWVVVRINALVTSGTHTLYAVLGRGDKTSWSESLSALGPDRQNYSISNTTVAWLTPAVGSEQYLYVDSTRTGELLVGVPSPGATAGANMGTANIYMATLTLIAFQSIASAIQIYGVSAREYIGT